MHICGFIRTFAYRKMGGTFDYASHLHVEPIKN
nr:MAG TPA: hypothetical protein [Caudoviricetes sp.]